MDNHNQIYFDSSVSTEFLEFQPYGAPVSFFVTVINTSIEHAQFELQLFPEGINEDEVNHLWYKKTPVSSRKMPPGAQVEFTVEIRDNPLPKATTIIFFVKVYSPQLPGFQRHRLRLIILPQLPLGLDLIPSYYSYLPAQNIKLSTRLTNPFAHAINVKLKITDFPFDLVEYLNSNIDVTLEAKTTREIIFVGKLKKCVDTLAGKYPFTIEAYISQRKSGVTQGTLEIIRFGNLKLIKFNDEDFPEKNSWLKCRLPPTNSLLPKMDKLPIIYQIQLQNTSNFSLPIPQGIKLNVQGNDTKGKQLDTLTINLKDNPNRILEPDQIIDAELQLNQKRHWWGKERKLQVQLSATASDIPKDYSYSGDRKIVDIYVRPFLPIWLQIIAASSFTVALLLLLIALIYQPHHTDAVKTVTFRRGSNNPEVYSGSADKTVRQWEINRNHPFCKLFNWQQYCLKSKGVLKLNNDQSIILLKFRSENNNILAIVPESDQVLYWDFEKGEQIDITHQGAPQILDLIFTKDSQNLFTINDENVCNWQQTNNGYKQKNCVFKNQEEQFPITSFTLNKDDQQIIFGGRGNKIYFWDWAQENQDNNYYLLQETCPQKSCTTNDYIKSLNIEKNILAIGDDQGYITLYDLNQCSPVANQEINCPKTEQWQIVSNSESKAPIAIKTITLTEDGRYLVVASEDGKIRLWYLTQDGKLEEQDNVEDYTQGIIIGNYHTSINSLDLVYAGNDQELLIVTGGEDHQVRLIIYKLKVRS